MFWDTFNISIVNLALQAYYIMYNLQTGGAGKGGGAGEGCLVGGAESILALLNIFPGKRRFQ